MAWDRDTNSCYGIVDRDCGLDLVLSSLVPDVVSAVPVRALDKIDLHWLRYGLPFVT
jgi:hypothetical protein